MEPTVEEDVTDFTLAYSTHILLCNTKMQLPHGEKCGLLGGNSSGKTTLIWSIANTRSRISPAAEPSGQSLSWLTSRESRATCRASRTC
jgi:ATPase subunit of ABC transporter with duplicated ATPase domains